MKPSILRAVVVTLSVAAFSLMSLSSRGADSGSSSDPMGGCCGSQSSSSSSSQPKQQQITCGQGTVQRGNQCVGTR